MKKLSETDLSVLRWIDKRGCPSYAAAECRWGHWLDGVVDDGFVEVKYTGERRSGVALTGAGNAAIAPKPRRARDATQPTGQHKGDE